MALAKERIIEMPVDQIQSKRMTTYSMSIICGRAVPDFRDGLKPVHRRALWALLEGGYLSGKPHRKSAKIVGDIIGKYHPHGDSSAYDAMVRLVQPWANYLPLVDGHGNFGSQGGDPAAAYRYTEARLQEFSEKFILDGIRKNGVDMVPTFDNEEEEPVTLPVKFPLLLVNGTSGIAAGGIASEIPPHNLHEVIAMTKKLIKNPDMTLQEVAEGIRPDFPTGGILCSNKAITDAYTTGRGNVRYRARIVEEQKGSKTLLVITEVQWNKAYGALLENIVAACKPKKDPSGKEIPPIITEVADIRDESAKGKVRIVIELKKDADAAVVTNKLYKHTECEVTQKIILIATERDDYFTFNIKELFTDWIEYRRSTVRRILMFDIKRNRNRMHVLEGLLKALNFIDEVVGILKKSKDTSMAKAKLISVLKITDMQADAILDLKLSRLVALEQDKLKKEHENLSAATEELLGYIRDPKKLDQYIVEELDEIVSKTPQFRDKETKKPKRLTEVTDIDTDLTHEDVIEDKTFLIALTKDKYIKRMEHTFRSQNRGGKGSSAGKVRDGDFVETMFYANSKDHLMVFTDTGRVFDIKVWQIEESGLQSVGKSIRSYVSLQQGEQVATVLNISNEQFENNDCFLMFATKKGIVKKTSLEEFRNIRETGIIAVKIRDDDQLLGVKYIDPQWLQDIFLATKNGFGIRFSHEDVSAVGRTTYGVMGIELKSEDDEVRAFDIVENDECFVMCFSEGGLGKKTLIHNPQNVKKGQGIEAVEDKGFPAQQRGGKGRIAMSLKDGDFLVKAMVGYNDQDLIMVTKSKILRTSTNNIHEFLRPTFGTKVIDLSGDDRVVDATIFNSEEEAEAE